MKLQVGKSYVNRRGEVVKILDFDADDDRYPYGDGERTYTADGSVIGAQLEPADLIAEAPEVAESCQFMPATEPDTQSNDGGLASAKSLREWYAGMALQTLLVENNRDNHPDKIAAWAYKIADAMIAASRK